MYPNEIGKQVTKMSQNPKSRLDQILMDRGLFSSREAARTAIIDGGILVDGEKQTKPGQAVKSDANIEVLERFKKPPYVSRGGLKLEKALKHFQINVTDVTAIDVGASTGGFTDCLLKAGAAFVYAVDVGYGQIDWSLRQDPRVRVLERTNIRYLSREGLLEGLGAAARLPDFAVMDCSFISVQKTVPQTLALMDEGVGELAILVKPQFEAGKEKVPKGGVIKDKNLHKEILQTTVGEMLLLNLGILGLTYSPIKGPSGNIEYLLHLGKNKPSSTLCGEDLSFVDDVVEEAFRLL